MSPTTVGSAGSAVHDHRHIELPTSPQHGAELDPWERIEQAQARWAIQSPIKLRERDAAAEARMEREAPQEPPRSTRQSRSAKKKPRPAKPVKTTPAATAGTSAPGKSRTAGQQRLRERIADLASEGATSTEIALELAIAPGTVRRHAKATGIDLPRLSKSPRSTWDVDPAVELARAGRTTTEIAHQVGVSTRTVSKALSSRGVAAADGRLRPSPRATPEDVVAQVVTLYTGQGRPSPPQIARQVGIMPATVRAILDREGVTRRDSRADYSGGTQMAPPATLTQLQQLYSDLGTVKAVAQHLDIGQTTAGRLLRASGVQLRTASEVQKGRPGRDGGARRLAQEITAAGVTSAQVRAWASEEGLPMAARGLPSRQTWQAYQDAHPTPLELPARLIQYVNDTYPETVAQDWLIGAPRRAQYMAQRAGLTLAPRPHPDASRSLVWPAPDTSGNAYMVRVDLPGKLNATTVQHLADLGVTPHLLAADATIDASVVTFVHGRAARAGDTADTAAVAETLRRMTGPSAKPPAGAELFLSWIARFQATAARRRPDWAAPLQDAADAVRGAHAATTSPDVLLHGDLVPANVIITRDGRAVFIDTEPHLGPIERDAAGWAHRSAWLSEDTAAPHLAVLEDHLDLDHDLCQALLRFCEITYQAYRSFRAPHGPTATPLYAGKALEEITPPPSAATRPSTTPEAPAQPTEHVATRA